MEDENKNNLEFVCEDDPIPIPWPEKGDKLFTASSDWQNNACLNQFNTDWHPYIQGYHRAADVLVKNIVEEDRFNVDYLVYPIIFLYRQYLELQLKAIILDGNQLFDRVCEPPITHHDILSLWTQCRRIFKEACAECPELGAVENCIKEFCMLDKSSMAFRYPVDKKENPSLPNVPNLINVRHLADTMAKIINLLDCAHTEIQVRLDAKLEMNSYCRYLFLL